jgi:hypothetical protein
MATGICCLNYQENTNRGSIKKGVTLKKGRHGEPRRTTVWWPKRGALAVMYGGEAFAHVVRRSSP